MKTITINQENTIESIIEFYQQFVQKYNLKLKKLDKNIQYQINGVKITQTYTSTIKKLNMRKVSLKKLTKGKKLIILIIKDTKINDVIIRKIERINRQENIIPILIEKNKIFETIEKIANDKYEKHPQNQQQIPYHQKHLQPKNKLRKIYKQKRSTKTKKPT